jgi:hypothetical protein
MSAHGNRCGCCTKSEPATPLVIDNRPGLDALAYRIGDFAAFRRAMIERIPKDPRLAAWAARDEHDYGIALLAMWAYLADILTFYNERIANETYLRTAVHRESVMRLAALLDYRPAPGAAAVTYLAFTLEKGKTLTIPERLRVQSVPGPDEKPQKFETVESIEADATLNEVVIYGLPAPHAPFARGSFGGPIETPLDVRPGHAMMAFDHRFFERKDVISLQTTGDILSLAWAPAVREPLDPRGARAVRITRELGLFGSNAARSMLTHVLSPTTDPPGVGIRYTSHDTDFAVAEPVTLPLDRKVTELKPGARVLVTRSGEEPAARFATIAKVETGPHELMTKGSDAVVVATEAVTAITLDARIVSSLSVVPIDRSAAAFALADDGAVWAHMNNAWSSFGGNHFTAVAAASPLLFVARGTDGALWYPAADGWRSAGGVFDLMAAALDRGFATVFVRGTDRAIWKNTFGAGGVWSGWTSLGGVCDRLAVATDDNGVAQLFVRGTDRQLWWHDGANWVRRGNATISELAVAVNASGLVDVFALHEPTGGVLHMPGGTTAWELLGGIGDRIAAARDGDRMRVFVRGTDKAVWQHGRERRWQRLGAETVEHIAAAPIRSDARVYAVTEEGALQYWNGEWRKTGPPMFSIPDRRRITVFEVAGDAFPLAPRRHPDTIDGDTFCVPLARLDTIANGRTVILDDASRQPHTARVVSSSRSATHLVIRIVPALPRALDAVTAVMYANVAKATHGETVRNEVLGSGDASARFQHFAIQKTPVTFVPNPTGRNGVASTAEVRVDGVRWQEVETLLGRANAERVFVTRIDEQESMSVQFGGAPGARPTTGRNNITATYRQGLGPAGNVRAGALSNLLDRPAGLKGATNLAPAQGGASPESLALIRGNAPNTVRTFGRIVSLRDAEDAAREHASVAKARATWSWQGEERVIGVTVALEGGSTLGDDLKEEIVQYLDARRDTNRRLIVQSHEQTFFELHADVQVHADHVAETVQSNVRSAVLAFFAFDSRDLGQPVHLSETYAALQRVTGVVAARISRLRMRGSSAALQDHLLVAPRAIAAIAPDYVVINVQLTTLGESA